MRKIFLMVLALVIVGFLPAQEITGSQVTADTLNATILPLQIDHTDSSSLTKESDRAIKPYMLLVRESDVLTRLNLLPIYTWSDPQDPARHIGPLPQDFNKIFAAGTNDKEISFADATGVSLAGIKALAQEIKYYQKTAIDLQKENDELERKTKALERHTEKQQREIDLLKRQVIEISAKLPR